MTDHLLTFDDYRALAGVNWSSLREMQKSEAHFAYRVAHPKEDTPRLMFGRAVHTAVLEPDAFPLQYVVFDGKIRRGKEWDEFAAANASKTILKRDEYESALSVRDAVRANPLASRLLKGRSEVSLTWNDPDTGLACKARLDHVCDGTFIDLKTTTTTDAWQFSATAARMLYHGQFAFYERGMRANGLLADNTTPRIIAVEVEPPYDVAVFVVTDDVMLAGEQMVADLMARVSEAMKASEWHGRYTTEQDLTLPAWLAPDPDEGLGFTIGGGA